MVPVVRIFRQKDNRCKRFFVPLCDFKFRRLLLNLEPSTTKRVDGKMHERNAKVGIRSKKIGWTHKWKGIRGIYLH